MRLLLLNNNPAVSRLIKLSVDKVGYEMDEFDDYGLVPLTNYDVIMVDNELYDEAELIALSEQVHCEYFLYICQRGSEKPSLINVSLEKPFLPTDFLTLLEKVKNVVDSFKAEETREESMADEKNDDEEIQAFDIDKIDTFDIDEEDELGLLEHSEHDLIDEDAKEDDDESSLTLDLEDDNLDTLDMNNGLADFDFVEEEEPSITQDKEEVEENKETESFEEISASILDRDDINEVKQLLDDNENEDKDEDEKDEDFDFSFGETSETLMEEEDKELSFDEDLAVEETDEEDDTEDDTEDTALALKEITFDEPVEIEDEVAQEIEEELPSFETQEEIIDDFAEEIEEKIEEEAAEEESVQPIVALELSGMDSLDVESLDDLNENLLKKAFGEEIEEDVEEAKPIENVHEIEVMRGEIESSIARSISGFAQSDILREALKGMKINISITFDEKN